VCTCRARKCGLSAPSRETRTTRSRLLVSAAVEPLHRGCAAGQCDQRTADQGLGTSRAGRPVPHVDRGYLVIERVCGARRSRRAGPPQSVSAPASALVSCRAAHCAQPVDKRLAPHESGDQSRVLIANLLSTCTTRGGHVLPVHHRLTPPQPFQNTKFPNGGLQVPPKVG
jgi:hypothetical protein